MPLRTAIVQLLLSIAVAPCAWAGAAEGDLFGYRLGSKYPVGPSTQGYFMFLGQAVLHAEKPEAPAEFQRVELITTPKTFTIINIYAVAEFEGETAAKELETRYADLLETMYAAKCTKQKAYLQEALKLLCAQKYELTVHRFKPDKPEEKHKVHVGLRVDGATQLGKKITAQFDKELLQLEREGKEQRLERARQQNQLKGLQ